MEGPDTLKYFTTAGENVCLDDTTRKTVRCEFVATQQGVTHFELRGPEGGDVVLLVGGLTIPLYYWDQFTDHLHRRGFRTLAYSTYGRGYSERVRGTYDEQFFTDQLTDLCVGLGVEPAHVVGSSMGALIAMKYLTQQEVRASSLSLVGPAGLDTKIPLPVRLLNIEPIGAALGKRFGSRFLDTHLSHNVLDPALGKQLTLMVKECFRVQGSVYSLCSTLTDFPLFDRHELYRRFARTSTPTMLAWGTEDNVTPIGRLDEVKSLLLPGRTHVLEACGHMAPYERPAEVAEHFFDFTDSLHEGPQ